MKTDIHFFIISRSVSVAYTNSNVVTLKKFQKEILCECQVNVFPCPRHEGMQGGVEV